MRFQSTGSFFLLLAFTFCTVSCSTPEEPTKITWDNWGVPHIQAQNTEDLFFADGWSQMHLHGNLILEIFGNSRGRSAEYWGESGLQNDVLIHTLGFPELATKWGEMQDPELKKIITSFVNGMNAYAESHPEAFEEKNRVVLPLTYDDVNLHSLDVVYTKFVGGGELGKVQRWSDMGSNTYAVGSSRSASGHAMLVQNPHLPWFGEFLFTEAHFKTSTKNLYGSTLVGLPGILLGFNENLGWSHTNNTIDNADTYELDLSGDGYLLDGEATSFETTTKTIKVKNEEGELNDHEIEILRSVHGPVVKKGENKALALRMVGYDSPNTLLQWWRMGNANNFEEFESALKMAQIPFWNVMYADKAGNIFYLFNGLIPVRKEGGWDYWDRVIPGGKSEDVWTAVHPYSDLPQIKNPPQGWLQNANDPPWTSTFPMLLNPDDFPPYTAPKGMPFRPQRAVRMLDEDESITFDELVNYKLSTRLEMADRLLDDLFAAVDQYGTAKGKEAKAVLENWDREANIESVGTLLFTQWALAMQVWDENTFATKWDEKNPRTTPDGLADPKKAVKTFEAVADDIIKKHGGLQVPWGDVYRLHYNSIDLPGNGANGLFGAFRVAWPGRVEGNKTQISGGDSWVGIIEFGDSIKAKVLLSYGNSSQKESPHHGDQLKLFSERKLRDALFYPEDLEGNTKRVEVLENGKFVEKK